MNDALSSAHAPAKIFRDAFRVGQIAEPLISFDRETPASAALAVMQPRRLAVVGVRERGLVAAYVQREDLLGDGSIVGAVARPIEPEAVIASDAPLDAAIVRLEGRSRLFVTALGAVGGIVTWTDVQKPPVRMWLFGLITLMEMAFDGLIEALHPDETWRAALSAGRLEKAEAILASRRAQNPGANVSLVSCLQLADKAQILVRDEATRTLLGVSSREEGQRRFRRLARLRDGLAHAQDIVTDEWPVILELAHRLDAIVSFGATFAAIPRSAPRSPQSPGL